MDERPKIKTSEITSPGYVWLDCEHYGLPDNTMNKSGYHVFYRPLDVSYKGNELVTDKMRDDIKSYYDRAQVEEIATDDAARAKRAEVNERVSAAMRRIPEALDVERLKRRSNHDLIANEGGDGYNPYDSWSSPGSLHLLRQHNPLLAKELELARTELSNLK